MVKRKARFINEDLCTGCQECVANCIYKEPKFTDEFNEGLASASRSTFRSRRRRPRWCSSIPTSA